MNTVLLIIQSMLLALWVSCNATGGGGSSTYEELLALVPDTPETRKGVHINNWAMMREQLNVSLPEPGYTEDDLRQFSLDLDPPFLNPDGTQVYRIRTAPAPWISGFHRNTESPWVFEFKRNIGFDVTDMNQSVLTAAVWLFPGETEKRLEIGIGKIDAAVTQELLQACSGCPKAILNDHNGTTFYTWENDNSLSERYNHPAFDGLLIKGQILVEDGQISRTHSQDLMKATIDTRNGTHPSLADNEDFFLLAELMSEMKVFNVTITTMAPNQTLGLPPDVPLLQPYNAIAAGSGKDENGDYFVMALAHPNEESAVENVSRLNRRFEEIVQSGFPFVLTSDGLDTENFIDIWELRTEGTLLIARTTERLVVQNWRLSHFFPPYGVYFAHE